MNIEEERKEWQRDADKVRVLADRMVKVMKEVDANPVVYMAIDMTFRPYVQWFHSARVLKMSPEVARSALIYLITEMIMYAGTNMGCVEEDGTKMPLEQWLGEFMLDLRDALIVDLEGLQKVGNA
jgi:hypothetical protein